MDTHQKERVMARYGGRFDADVVDEDHRQHCPGCRACDRIDNAWDRMTSAELAAAHGLEVGK